MKILCPYSSAAKRLDEGPPALERCRSKRQRALWREAAPAVAPDIVPCLEVMHAASAQAGATLVVVELEGDPE